jgi:hypothetical protein
MRLKLIEKLSFGEFTDSTKTGLLRMNNQSTLPQSQCYSSMGEMTILQRDPKASTSSLPHVISDSGTAW